MQGKIEIEGTIYTCKVTDGFLRVTAPDGREKLVEAGKPYPHVTARMLAAELHSARKLDEPKI